MRDGQHQLLAGRQQRLIVAVGPLQRPAVADAAVDVAPQHGHEQQHQHHGSRGDDAQYLRGTLPDRLVRVDAPHEEGRLLLLEIEDQAVDLGVHQVVAVPQAQPLAPRLVVDAQPFAGHAVLQGAQDQRDRVPDRLGRQRLPGPPERIDDDFAPRDHHVRVVPGRAEQVGQPAEEPPFGARHGHCVGTHEAGRRQRVGRGRQYGREGVGQQGAQRVGPGERVRGKKAAGREGKRVGAREAVARPFDERADVLLQQARRGPGADRPPQAHRPPLLVREQPHDAVQTHRLQRIPASGDAAQRVDAGPHGPQLAPVAPLEGLVSGDHQLAVALGLVEVVEHLIDRAALVAQQRVAAVGRGEAHRLPIDVSHREDAGRDEDDVSRGDLRFDELRLFHDLKYRKIRANFGTGRRFSAAAGSESAGFRYLYGRYRTAKP